MVEAQVQAYELEKGEKVSDIGSIVSDGYLEKAPVCPNGDQISITNGVVVVAPKES